MSRQPTASSKRPPALPPTGKLLTIAIDGPAAAGKGTLARRIAATYGLDFLDTGALYRGVAWLILDAQRDPADADYAIATARAFDTALIEKADIRTRRVGSAASIVAANPGVRAALLDFQRRFASNPPTSKRGAVLDGRDIGTIVCPDAAVKLFVTASPEARARRRWLELVQGNPALTEDEVLADIKARDGRDSGRTSAPLIRADDAHLIDTTFLSIDAAYEAAAGIIDAIIT